MIIGNHRSHQTCRWLPRPET